MPKTPSRRLKVFQAQLGFYDTIVAAPSQAAALRAWGTHQNLFASGEARPATDPADVAAALEQPETVLRRALGSGGAFSLAPTGLPKLPEAPRKPQRPTPAPSRPPPRPPAPDRSRLDAAAAALRELEEKRREDEAAFRRRADALEAERRAAEAAFTASRAERQAALTAARAAYRKAGGAE